LKAGFALTVFNRTSERAKPLLELGVSLAANAGEAAEAAEVVISMVAEDNASPERMGIGSEGAYLPREIPPERRKITISDE
jgi:3-hydroxyisobutyrate dehydrogenase-like beta-hydroxyacid dehydrogenase